MKVTRYNPAIGDDMDTTMHTHPQGDYIEYDESMLDVVQAAEKLDAFFVQQNIVMIPDTGRANSIDDQINALLRAVRAYQAPHHISPENIP